MGKCKHLILSPLLLSYCSLLPLLLYSGAGYFLSEPMLQYPNWTFYLQFHWPQTTPCNSTSKALMVSGKTPPQGSQSLSQTGPTHLPKPFFPNPRCFSLHLTFSLYQAHWPSGIVFLKSPSFCTLCFLYLDCSYFFLHLGKPPYLWGLSPLGSFSDSPGPHQCHSYGLP